MLEAVNDVLNVYNTAGQSALPDNTATNIVGGFPREREPRCRPELLLRVSAGDQPHDRAFGPELTDPSCLYDAQTQRWFVVVLTLDRCERPFTDLVNHLDLAVSKTSDPTGAWNIYKVDVTNDGTNTGGRNPGPVPRRLPAYRRRR